MNGNFDFSQYLAYQKKLREETGRLTAETVEEVWGDMEQFPRLLDVVERFNLASGTLSGGSANALLIYAQCPGATRLGSFEDWKKEQAYIRKGEKGIRIYVRSSGKEDSKTHRTRYSCIHPILSRFRLISRARGRKSNRICLSYIFISPYVILHCMGGYENKMKFYVWYYFILYQRCRRIEK
ncbi:ArdC-like ssDNA-binding domain-containing protein [Acutalibacter sp. 1XD8-36]|uniref:ArdC-like ssDNA-binding domain-containing protein n=1 Tax=Acutalibacter sp. 1XD8-36 TaxID=2320852 RepID=UPI001412D4DF|nr:ArdC-like ssDNA-binding domain-containing protein [Acutalibacter sp. 1XD8-36]NBJ90195.1 hypothetical protein [Acutalibacter sp. 1XD8-36]